MLSSVLKPAVVLARIFWVSYLPAASRFREASGDLFSILPRGTALILAGLGAGSAEGMHKAQAGSLQS